MGDMKQFQRWLKDGAKDGEQYDAPYEMKNLWQLGLRLWDAVLHADPSGTSSEEHSSTEHSSDDESGEEQS